MRVRFWGTRGSIPTPGPGTLRYGGNTACVELRTADNQLIILDCGTGLRELGKVLDRQPQPISGHILLSHTHWDHIQGIAFFAPAFRSDNQFTFYAAADANQRMFDALSMHMDYLYFPLSLAELAAKLSFKEVGEEVFSIGSAQVKTQCLNHTGLTLGYRIYSGGASVVYVADHEAFSSSLYRTGVSRPSLADIVHAGDRRHVEFLTGADLVIHEAQYTWEEYAHRRNWGHSPIEYVVQVCVAAGAKHLVLTHHDPDHDDEVIQQIEVSCQQMARRLGSDLRVQAAAEGMEVVIPERDAPVTLETDTVSSENRSEPACILVVDDEPEMLQLISVVLSKDQYRIVTASSGRQALEIINRDRPDLVLLDVMMPGLDGYAVLKQLRLAPATRNLKVMMVTAKAAEEDIVRSFADGVTDYVSKPLSPAVLRARVRRWLLNT